MSTRNPWLALLILLLPLLFALRPTRFESERCGVPEPTLSGAGPTASCPTGYDQLGRCVFHTLLGGARAALIPTAFALGVLLLGAVVFSLSSVLTERGAELLRVPLLWLEGIPRLLTLLLVYIIGEQRPGLLGLGLGLVLLPAVITRLDARLRQLYDQSHLEFAYLHGIPGHRILVQHVFRLSLLRPLLQQLCWAGAASICAQISIGYVVNGNVSGSLCDWGRVLEENLFRPVIRIRTLSLQDSLSVGLAPGFWSKVVDFGIPQGCSVVAFILATLWAWYRVGEWVGLERSLRHARPESQAWGIRARLTGRVR